MHLESGPGKNLTPWCQYEQLSLSTCHGSTTAMLCWWAYQPTCTTVGSQCSTLLRDPSPAYDAPTTSPTHSPVSTGWRSRSVFSLSWRQSFTERYFSSITGCRSAPFVRYAVQSTSEIVTHWPTRCPPVAVFSCWRPSFRCGWCSTMAQSATWHRREWHTVTFP